MTLRSGEITVVCNGGHQVRGGRAEHAADCPLTLPTPYVTPAAAVGYAREHGWSCRFYVDASEDMSPECSVLADRFARASLPERWRMMGYLEGMSPSGQRAPADPRRAAR